MILIVCKFLNTKIVELYYGGFVISLVFIEFDDLLSKEGFEEEPHKDVQIDETMTFNMSTLFQLP